MLVFEKRLSEDTGVKIETNVEVDFAIVQGCDYREFASKFRKFNADVRKMLGSGNTCILAKARREFVHWTWVAFIEAYVTEIERNIGIASDSA